MELQWKGVFCSGTWSDIFDCDWITPNYGLELNTPFDEDSSCSMAVRCRLANLNFRTSEFRQWRIFHAKVFGRRIEIRGKCQSVKGGGVIGARKGEGYDDDDDVDELVWLELIWVIHFDDGRTLSLENLKR